MKMGEATKAIDAALRALDAIKHELLEQVRWVEEARAQAPQMVFMPDDCWRSVADQSGFPAEGKVWVSDGERVWDVWARGGIPPSATACKFWLDGYRWPAPPSPERVAVLAGSEGEAEAPGRTLNKERPIDE